MVYIKLENLKKSFGSVIAVDNVSLKIAEGEFFTILGPSGCGKTTTLRMIAGFYKPDNGKIYFDEKLINLLAPEKRNIGMVFQNYALWPHMTVFKNVSFGLEMRKVPKLAFICPIPSEDPISNGGLKVLMPLCDRYFVESSAPLM